MNFPAPGQDAFFKAVSHGIEASQRRGKPYRTGFLTPAQQNQIRSFLGSRPFEEGLCRFDGGREHAIRCRFVYGEDFEAERLVCALKAKVTSQEKELTHSDVLGALMHSGFRREAIGDIAIEQDTVYVLCLPSTAQAICDDIRLIGRRGVSFEPCLEAVLPPARFEEQTLNISSMRTDCIVAALARCSRSDALEMIRRGFVRVNDETVESVRTLCNNDTVSVRRCGKYILKEPKGVSRKGRLILQILKYQ